MAGKPNDKVLSRTRTKRRPVTGVKKVALQLTQNQQDEQVRLVELLASEAKSKGVVMKIDEPC